jgi:hypothetical protein
MEEANLFSDGHYASHKSFNRHLLFWWFHLSILIEEKGIRTLRHQRIQFAKTLMFKYTYDCSIIKSFLKAHKRGAASTEGRVFPRSCSSFVHLIVKMLVSLPAFDWYEYLIGRMSWEGGNRSTAKKTRTRFCSWPWKSWENKFVHRFY